VNVRVTRVFVLHEVLEHKRWINEDRLLGKSNYHCKWNGGTRERSWQFQSKGIVRLSRLSC
jgi:hypothetical protein